MVLPIMDYQISLRFQMNTLNLFMRDRTCAENCAFNLVMSLLLEESSVVWLTWKFEISMMTFVYVFSKLISVVE